MMRIFDMFNRKSKHVFGKAFRREDLYDNLGTIRN